MNSPKLAGYSILIVEDEPLIAMDIAQGFRDAGADTTVTSTLRQALILVEHDSLTAAILDHALGDGDSTRLCERLKKRNIPFVIYSGFSDLTGAYGDAPLVEKPATVDVLVTTVEGLIAGKPG